MGHLSLCSAMLVAALGAVPAIGCPPPPPGYMEPSREEFLQSSLKDATDIVYGVVTKSNVPGQPALFRVIHVYRGGSRAGDTLSAPVGWGHPVPFCVGMMGQAPSRSAGAYGVIAFNNANPELNFIKPDDVQIMIRRGWIRSAQAR